MAAEEQECANPLLLKWIKEWYDTAKEQSSKSVFSLRKAYNSMKACPIPYDHPSQAQELAGIGPKLCEKLTGKLQAHCEENGLPMPEDPRKVKKKRRSDGGTENEDISAKKARTVKKKSYVPEQRSGPYAILIALSTLAENASIGLTKIQTIELAQPHCDASFTAPSDPTKTYTAWSSVKTLITKDLIYVSGGVSKKYLLTEEGWEVAKKIKAACALDDGQVTGIEDGSSVTISNSTSERVGLENKASESQPHPESTLPLKGRQRTKATVYEHLDDLELVDIESHEGNEFGREPGCRRKRFKGGSAWDALSDIEGDLPITKSKISADSDGEDCFIELLSSSPPAMPQRMTSFREPLRPSAPHKLNRPKKLSPTVASKRVPSLVKGATAGGSSQQTPAPQVKARQESSLTPTQPQAEAPPRTLQIPPGSFTVELILDTREVRSKTDRDYIQSNILTHGVRATSRALDVGDALWVARIHNEALLATLSSQNNPSNPSSTASTPQSNEIVLDYILERKRLDDLIGSIKDGRFTEQKFRLKKSGVRNVIYLIEDITLSDDKKEQWHEAVLSAVASTQVVNGFFVKRTRKLDDSIRYLANLTKLLKKRYESHPLSLAVGDPEDVAAQRLAGRHHRHHHNNNKSTVIHISYPSFSALATKSSSLSLRDLYLKMLLCIRGLTAEKALAVQARWATPRALAEAYKALEGKGSKEGVVDKAKREMVWAELGSLVGRRAVGKAVSARMAEVWGGVPP